MLTHGVELQTAQYLYTGDRLFIRGTSALLEFQVEELTADELRLFSTVEMNGVRVERSHQCSRENDL